MRVGGNPKPVLDIMYTRPHVEMSSNLLVGVKGILIIRHTKLRGMSCTCEPMETMYILQSPNGTVKQRISGP